MLYFANGSTNTELSDDEIQAALFEVLTDLGPKSRVIAVPPDFTRFNSRAGQLTCLSHEFYGDALVDVLPAVGTHFEMPAWQREKMFPGMPENLFRYHNWRSDAEVIGEVPAEQVAEFTEGIYTQPWPCQLSKRIWHGNHDLVLSIGQVVPHEVIGMANYNKNLFVGTGGVRGINESHYIGAVYGIERILGRAENPLRRILNYAQDNFCGELPILYVLTVIGYNENRELVMRGLYIGDDVECFQLASELSLKVNFEMVPKPLEKVVVYLDPEEFHSTWLGNKSIYRTRMAIADGGELVVLAPGVKTFGEDPVIDKLIRRHGYLTTSEVLERVQQDAELRDNLSAAAHLIHGSSEGRFKITYCPGNLTAKEVENASYSYGDLAEYMERYPVGQLEDGPQNRNGEEFFYVSNPALGLWAHESRMTEA